MENAALGVVGRQVQEVRGGGGVADALGGGQRAGGVGSGH